MIKKWIGLIALSVILFACGSRTEQPPQAENQDVAVLTVASFDSLAGEYSGKEIQIEGLVDHVCREGGKKMFLVRTDGEGRVKVTTGENIPSFDVALEGSDVIVKGVVDELRVDEPYLVQWEKELKDQEALQKKESAGSEPAGQQGQGTHMGMGEQADQGTHTDAWDQIQAYRDEIAASGKGYLSFYSVICSEYKVKGD
jgi:hypothetical protein